MQSGMWISWRNMSENVGKASTTTPPDFLKLLSETKLRTVTIYASQLQYYFRLNNVIGIGLVNK